MKSNTFYFRFILISALLLIVSACADDPTADNSIGSPVVTTSPISLIGLTSAVSGGTVTSDGGEHVSARGICWSTSPMPIIYDIDRMTIDGSGTGGFISALTDLTPNTTYYVRAYASNSVYVAYGEQLVFTTASYDLPMLTTNEVTSIEQYAATCGGTITSDGGADISVRGVCWSMEEMPTILNTKTEDGTGIGSFESLLTELEAGTMYYVRAYATTGAGTGYGNQVSFMTSPAHPYVEISAGYGHALAIKSDGTLWGWGYNEKGQVGDGTTVNRNSPMLLGNNFVKVAAGAHHSLAIKEDGTLWGWGDNSEGQLGDGTKESKTIPTQVGEGYSEISTGYYHTLALKADGTLWAWGANFNGRLGDGTTESKINAIQIGSDYKAIAAGENYSLALKIDGTLWTWGFNGNGQLGDGTTEEKLEPQQIGTDYKAIAAKFAHCLALKNNGDLWAWGYNAQGQIGDGSNEEKLSPVFIESGYEIIAAGSLHSLAVKTDNTLWGWGFNTMGQLGDGSNTDRKTPVNIIGEGFSKISGGTGFSMALRANGSLYTMGDNFFGQLGDGTTASKNTPTLVK